MREKRLERDMAPLFSNVPDGIRVLDTVPDGAAEAMGIVPGDIVVSVNNKPVTEEEDLEEFFKEYVNFIWVGVKSREGTLRTLEYRNYKDGIDGLDIIVVPRSTEGLSTVRERKGFIKRMFGK
jgi:C-terminal processing protease CtpA/Prc